MFDADAKRGLQQEEGGPNAGHELVQVGAWLSGQEQASTCSNCNEVDAVDVSAISSGAGSTITPSASASIATT